MANRRRRQLADTEAPVAPAGEQPPRRRTWLWVLLAAAAGAGIFLVVRRVLAARRPPGVTTDPAQDAGATGRAEKVVVLGDSLTAGYLPYLKKLLPAVEVMGEGWVGKQIATIAANGERYLDPSVTRVVIGGGVNDLASGHSAARAVRDLEALLAVARARAPQAYIYVLMIPPCPENAACKRVAGELAKFNAAVRGLAGAYAVDMSDVGGHAKDGLHRTAQGYLQMASVVASVLQ